MAFGEEDNKQAGDNIVFGFSEEDEVKRKKRKKEFFLDASDLHCSS